MMRRWRGLTGGALLAGLLPLWAPSPAAAIMATVPRGRPVGSPEVRQALESPTAQGKVEALLRVLTSDDLPAAMEAMDMLAGMGPAVVPRLVSEMRRARNNWLIGAALAKMGPGAVEPLAEMLETADEVAAVDCVYLLGELQDRRAVPTLARFLEDPREKVRVYVVTALLQIGGDRAVEAVLLRLTREGKGVSGFIVESLLRHGRRNADPLLRNLDSPDARVRAEVAYLLGRLRDPRAADRLIGLLKDSEPKVRRSALFALGELSETLGEAQDLICEMVEMLGDPVDEVAATAREALVRFGERAVSTLLGKCRCGTTRELLASVNALREIGSPKAEPLMIELLEHRDRSVKVAAVAALIVVGTKASVEPLLNALRDESLRWFASLALEKLGPENPELFLTTQPNDPTMAMRTELLVRLGAAVRPILCEYLRGDSPNRMAVALWVLGEIGDGEAAAPVADLLAHPLLGWLAGRTLRRLGDQGFDQLSRRAASPRDDPGALQAIDALALYDEPRALRALEQTILGSLPRASRVRAAVRLSMIGEPESVARLRKYLEEDGRDLWPDVEGALRAEGQIH